MRIAVFSDTHNRINNCIYLLENMPVDMIFHLGDCVSDAQKLESLFNDIPFEFVRGNNDFSNNVPNDKLITVANKKILLTHGHLYKVKTNYDYLRKKTTELKADLTLFGHTHLAYSDGRLLNPGSAGTFDKPSYGIIEIENNNIKTAICTF